MEKYDLPAKHLRIAEIANEMFQIPLDWDYDGVQVEKSNIEQFKKLYVNLVEEVTGIDDLFDLIIVLTSLYSAAEHSDYPELPLPTIQKHILLEDLNRLKNEIKEKIYNADHNIAEDNIRIYMKTFWMEEYDILTRCHFDQNASGVIVNRLKSKVSQTTQNIIRGEKASRSKIERTVRSSVRMAKQDLSAKTRDQYIREPRLARLKDRAVGICTVFGDTMPIVLGYDVGLASWYSTLLGGTAMAVLPSYSR